jgi:hypothetical protein
MQGWWLRQRNEFVKGIRWNWMRTVREHGLGASWHSLLSLGVGWVVAVQFGSF